MIENPPLPNKGFVDPHVAFCIGVIGGIGSYASAKTIKKILNIDDVLDVTSLQVPTPLHSPLSKTSSWYKYYKYRPYQAFWVPPYWVSFWIVLLVLRTGYFMEDRANSSAFKFSVLL